MFKRIFFSFSLVVLLCSFVYADDWRAIDRVLYNGTTDSPISISWDAVDGKKLVMIRFIYNTNNSNNVTYNVFDGNDLKLSKTIDQTIEADAGKWMYVGYCSTQNNSIRIITQRVTDAIKICTGVCDTEPIILTEGVVNEDNYIWTFPFLAANDLRVDYELYLYDTMKDMKVCAINTSNCSVKVILPRTGFYIVYARSHRAVSNTEIDMWATWSKEDLLSLIEQRTFRDARDYIKNYPNATQEDLYSIIIEKGETSEWINSTLEAFSLVDCEQKAWWMYGHIAAPGGITIE